MRGHLQTYVRDQFLSSVKTLSVCFVYEDDESHYHATALYEFLLGEFDENAQLTATWWRTSLLSDDRLARAAARATGTSDLIVLAVGPGSEPSAQVHSWIESWPQQIDLRRPPKLVVLLQGSGPSNSQNEWDAYLRDFTARRKLLYLPGSPAGMVASSIGHSRQEDSSPEPRHGSQLNRPIEPYAHWGLNE